MLGLVAWYREQSAKHDIGFFQIAGGIAGDFPICTVPLIDQDLKQEVKYWSYFCQISDSTTSYGSYSGAVPNEKITWGKLSPATPSFVIESDATIVFPLVAAFLLDW
jgi:deoxyhypusine synthase